ncbi:hypothetical protein [Paenibacillus daejeonensis]|uniref:hypothetical protein n=1 Tax=Paenibacillus daejeonensis TaxID=135193 RepID=UPI00035CC68D|nr:hypothetical protein [Paenibacillus daejeonensis]
MSKIIVKAQRSIMGQNTVLIYNKDRSVSGELPNEGAIETALGDRDKVYFEATVDDAGLLHLHKEIRNQNW